MFTSFNGFYCSRKGVWCSTGLCFNCSLLDVGYYTYTFPTPKKRIIEKFDEKGNLIERITEEE